MTTTDPTAPQEPERVVKVWLADGEILPFRCGPGPKNDEGWLVHAPHDQPPVPADVAERERWEAFQEGWDRKDSVAFQGFDAAYAAYTKRRGER